MWKTLVTLALLLVSKAFETHEEEEEECLIQKEDRYESLATKTPYAYVFNNETDNVNQLDGVCVPMQMWLLTRHGTRYPSLSGIKAIKERIPSLLKELETNLNNNQSGKLCKRDIELLAKWSPQVEVDQAKQLHGTGELEMILLAERYQERFPVLLTSDYHEESFRFRATKAQRAQQSQLFFAVGLFNRKVAHKVAFDPPVLVNPRHDPLIRFYKLCTKWQKEVKRNVLALKEQKLFEQSSLFKTKLVQDLSKKLAYSLDLNDIDAIYVACVFGQAWFPQKLSPWCSLLSQEHKSILEYREDLEYYWIDGYGYPINYEQACVLIKDVLDNFDNVTVGSKHEENSIFYFTHSGTLLKFLAYLNLSKDDEHLRHDNYEKQAHNRRWKTSLMDPFANNVAFVLQSCNQGQAYKVGMLINEVLTVIPGCGTNLWCDFDHFKGLFEKDLVNCDLHDICNMKEQDLDEEDGEDDRF